jgi:hypothetical protein
MMEFGTVLLTLTGAAAGGGVIGTIYGYRSELARPVGVRFGEPKHRLANIGMCAAMGVVCGSGLGALTVLITALAH